MGHLEINDIMKCHMKNKKNINVSKIIQNVMNKSARAFEINTVMQKYIVR